MNTQKEKYEKYLKKCAELGEEPYSFQGFLECKLKEQTEYDVGLLKDLKDIKILYLTHMAKDANEIYQKLKNRHKEIVLITSIYKKPLKKKVITAKVIVGTASGLMNYENKELLKNINYVKFDHRLQNSKLDGVRKIIFEKPVLEKISWNNVL